MTRKRKIAIVNTDDDAARAICAAAGIADQESEVQTLADPDATAAYLAEAGASVVFFGIGQDSEAALKAVQQYNQRASRSAVIGIMNRASSDLLLEAVRAGVDEFLTAPLDGGSIGEAVRNACRKKGILQSDSSRGEGRIFTVFSGKGGCGKTMLAINLAYHLAQIGDASVIIVDLNLQFGNAATFLDLQPRHTIIECLQGDGVVEDEVLVRMPARHESGLSVLSGPDDPADAEELRPEHVHALLDALRQKYDFVIVDTASKFDEHILTALDMSDKVLLISDTLVPSVRNTQRCLKVFEKLGYEYDKIVLVVNRCDKRVGAKPKELQQAFEKPIETFVPNDFGPVMNSVDAGLPVAEVAEKSEVVAAIRKLALSLAGDTQEQGGREGLIKKLSGLIGK